VRNIAEIAKTKKFDGITDVQDYSDKLGMRIQVELRRDVNPNKALNYLLKKTSLRTTFGAIMLSLVDGAPRVSPLLTVLDEYVRHRTEVIERRTWYELMRSLEEVHLNEGYQIARKFLDEVIKTIRASKDAGVARVNLVRKFDMSPFQANAVLAMPLRRLTQLAQEELETTYKDALRRAQDLMDILSSPARLKAVLKGEIETLRDKHGDERRTKIIAREAGEFSEEDLIPEEEAIISISRDGYIKRISTDAYRQQKRGGKGMKNVMKSEDEPENVFQVNTHDYILFFTNKGKAYKLRAYDIPESSRYAKGMPVINYIAIESEERVTATVNVKEHKGKGFLTMITRYGEIKRTALDQYQNLRSNGLKTFDIEEGDELIWVLKSDGKDDIVVVTHNGQSIRFKETDVRDRSRTAGGVRAIKLKKNDFIVSADIADDEAYLLVVGENGFGKRTKISEYRKQGRGGSGILTMNCTAKTGRIVGSRMVRDKDKLLVLTANGKGIRMKVRDIRLVGRVAQGVKLIDLQEGDKVASIAVLVDEDELQKQTETKAKPKSDLFDE
jgi:DNA gyrase subunit A